MLVEETERADVELQGATGHANFEFERADQPQVTDERDEAGRIKGEALRKNFFVRGVAGRRAADAPRRNQSRSVASYLGQ